MISLLIKSLVTVVFIILLTEIAKRSAYLSALIIAFPIVTVLTVGNLYLETGDAARATKFAYTTFWLIVPSSAFFLTLFLAQKAGAGFWLGFVISLAMTIVSIWAFTLFLKFVGIDLFSNT